MSTFAEALAEVYSNTDYMTRYMDGLLLTQSLWFNHAATFEMFLNRLLPLARSGARYLEIGPGHGLMTYFAARTPAIDTLEVWDVSSVSLAETRTALAVLGIAKSDKVYGGRYPRRRGGAGRATTWSSYRRCSNISNGPGRL